LNGNNLLRTERPIKGAVFQKRHKDDASLEQTIRHGFPSEGMPAFPKHVVNDQDMKALMAYIRSLTPKNSK
jgi:mono/diheme cytochrome c family protein